MRLPLCILAFALSAWAADIDTPQPVDASAATADEAQAAPAPQTPAPADSTKPADTTPPAPPPKYGGWVFSGQADGYITANWNHPGNNTGPWENFPLNFNLNYGQPELNLIKGTLDKSDKVIGIHLDVGAGEAMRLIHAFDPAAIEHQGLRYVEQMYA